MILFLILPALFIGIKIGKDMHSSEWEEFNKKNCELQHVLDEYNAVLHEIWVLHPGEIEELRRDSQNFANLNELLKDDYSFNSVFTYWMESDSIMYYNGMETYKMLSVICTMYNIESLYRQALGADEMPKLPRHDRHLAPTPQLELYE